LREASALPGVLDALDALDKLDKLDKQGVSDDGDDYALEDDYSCTDYGPRRQRSPEPTRDPQPEDALRSRETAHTDGCEASRSPANTNAKGDQPLTALLSREERRKRARS
jgi:hypothetical protein